uniref:Uncharacterized protein n=1 Tax=Steinernema glaseri TaxID=37863 RepID=A0A1I8A5D7_9BILA
MGDLRRVRSETGIYSSSEVSGSLSESYSKSIANIDCDCISSSIPAEAEIERTIVEDTVETETTADTHSIDSSSLKSTRRERIRERASEMAMRLGGVGRAKVNEFWNRRSKHSSDTIHQSAVELATEAEELGEEETPRENGKGSPTSGLKKKLASIKKSSPKSSAEEEAGLDQEVFAQVLEAAADSGGRLASESAGGDQEGDETCHAL